MLLSVVLGMILLPFNRATFSPAHRIYTLTCTHIHNTCILHIHNTCILHICLWQRTSGSIYVYMDLCVGVYTYYNTIAIFGNEHGSRQRSQLPVTVLHVHELLCAHSLEHIPLEQGLGLVVIPEGLKHILLSHYPSTVTLYSYTSHYLEHS